MFGVSFKCGAHRLVFLTKGYALKIPRASAISSGRRANRTETDTWKATHDEGLCPVLCGNAWGLFVLMPFARALSDKEFDEFQMKDALIMSNPFIPNNQGGDFKQSNFGMVNGRIVKIDYGGIPPRTS
jgi:hypothetical protein